MAPIALRGVGLQCAGSSLGHRCPGLISPCRPGPAFTRAPATRVRAVAEEGEGVQALLARDRKLVSIPAEEEDAPTSPPEPEYAAESAASTAARAAAAQAQQTPGRGSKGAAKPSRSKQGRRSTSSAAASDGETQLEEEATSGPRTSRQALDAGMELFQQQQYEAAIELFQQALELPGSGSLRFAGTVREYACPSDGEEQAALYNMACAYAQLRQQGSALTCLEAALDSGFDQYSQIRADPDLELVRGPELDRLLNRYDGLLAKGNMLLKKKASDAGKKAWYSIGW